MIEAAAADQLARPSLERLLLAAVRLEFRGEVFVAPRGSSLLGSGCEVAGGTGYEHYRPWGRASGRALCELHGQRWIKEGRPEIEVWLVRAGPLRALCAAPRCESRMRAIGLRHAPVRRPPTPRGCRVQGGRGRVPGERCAFPTVPGKALCDAHLRRFRQRARNRPLTVVGFVAEVDAERERAQGAYVLRPVSGVLRLELQFSEHEHDAGRAVRLRLFNDAVAVLARENPRSVLDRDVTAWRKLADSLGSRRLRLTGAMIALAHRRLCELRDHAGDPWAPDRWTIARLPLSDAHARHRTKSLDFATIGRPWLRELLKRWARYRLQTGTLKPQGIWRRCGRFASSSVPRPIGDRADARGRPLAGNAGGFPGSRRAVAAGDQHQARAVARDQHRARGCRPSRLGAVAARRPLLPRRAVRPERNGAAVHRRDGDAPARNRSGPCAAQGRDDDHGGDRADRDRPSL